MTGLFLPYQGAVSRQEADATGSPDIRYRTAGPHSPQDPQLPSLFTKTVEGGGGGITVLDPETGAEGHRAHHPLYKMKSPGWRVGSAVKSTDCSSEGPEFKFQQPHGGSQPSIM